MVPQLKGALVPAPEWAIVVGSSPSLPSLVRCLAVLDLGKHSGVSIYTHRFVSPADRLDTLLRAEDSSAAQDARDFAAAGRPDHQSTPSSRR
jgi:hypothetical protein